MVVKETANIIADHQDSHSLNQVNPLNIITLYFLPSILILFSVTLPFPKYFVLLTHFNQNFRMHLSVIYACSVIKEPKNHKY
jgi:hypothetical protein